MVTAKDGATDPRLATATVTVKVVDTEDELPIFHIPKYEVEVPENVPDYVVAHVHVSITPCTKTAQYLGTSLMSCTRRECGDRRTIRTRIRE